MTQITTGSRALLSASAIYDAVQNLLGAKRSRQELVTSYIRPRSGDTILDVGCGTCAILDLLPGEVDYIGIDLSPRYIESARRKYGDRGTFRCMDVAQMPSTSLPPVTIAIAVGLLHHLEDSEVLSLFSDIAGCMAPSGRLITIDPCFDTAQTPLARYLISRDRGQNVRELTHYTGLARQVFQHVSAVVRHDLSRIPYTHAILECTK